MKNTERLGWIDTVKGIGIICVMFGHLGIEIVDRIVFTFHMPLFFLISGYFLNVNLRLWEFVKEKAKRLLIPYYVTGSIICLLLILADIIRRMWSSIISDIGSMLVAIIYGSSFSISQRIQGIGAIWFLWALFWSVTIVKIVDKHRWPLGWIGCMWVISYISGKYIWLPLSIQPAMCASVFVYCGYKLRGTDIEQLIKNRMLFSMAISTFILEIFLGIRVDMANNTYIMGIISVVGALGSVWFIFCIAYIIDKKNFIINKYFKVIGKFSLYMLCIHQIEMRVFPWSIVKTVLQALSLGNYFYFVVIFTRIIGCSLCMVCFLKIKSMIVQKADRGLISDK